MENAFCQIYPEGHNTGDLQQMKGAYPGNTPHRALSGITGYVT